MHEFSNMVFYKDTNFFKNLLSPSRVKELSLSLSTISSGQWRFGKSSCVRWACNIIPQPLKPNHWKNHRTTRLLNSKSLRSNRIWSSLPCVGIPLNLNKGDNLRYLVLNHYSGNKTIGKSPKRRFLYSSTPKCSQLHIHPCPLGPPLCWRSSRVSTTSEVWVTHGKMSYLLHIKCKKMNLEYVDSQKPKIMSLHYIDYGK